MTDSAKFIIGLAFTALAQIAAVSYMQGGVNTSVKTLIGEVADMRGDIAGMTGKVYTIQSNSKNNGVVIRQFDGRVSRVEGKLDQQGQRIAILEFAAGSGGQNASN